MSVKHKPRNDFVLVRKVVLGKTPSGIMVGDETNEGLEFRVVAFGPKVTDLKKDDKVLVIGARDSYMFLPNSSDLFLTRQENICLTYEG